MENNLSDDILKSAAQLVEKQFELAISSSDENALFGRNAIVMALAARIDEMLQNNFEALMHIFYRIDLSEKKVMDVLTGISTQPSIDLAEMVVDRQIQKAITRQQFSK